MLDSGKKLAVQKIATQIDSTVDLGLFFLPGIESERCFQVSKDSPRIGTEAFLIAYPGSERWNGSHRRTDGNIESTRVVGYEYEFNRPSLQGESGGPLFVGDHVISGIISHTDTNSSLITTIPSIRRFLISHIGRVPKCRLDTPSPPIDCPPALNTSQLEERIKALEEEIARLKLKKGPAGPIGSQGLTGNQGPKGDKGDVGRNGRSGMVTVILTEDGEELKRVENVRAGSTVRLNVNRKKQEIK